MVHCTLYGIVECHNLSKEHKKITFVEHYHINKKVGNYNATFDFSYTTKKSKSQKENHLPNALHDKMTCFFCKLQIIEK